MLEQLNLQNKLNIARNTTTHNSYTESFHHYLNKLCPFCDFVLEIIQKIEHYIVHEEEIEKKIWKELL